MEGWGGNGNAGRADEPLTEAAGLELLRGEEPAFESVKAKILFAARSDVTVLVTGDTGTGKELTARAIHYLSDRSVKPFLPVNCGAIPADLFENELFGHHRGAFTDARSPQRGLVAEAEGGTLFLDEIDALPPANQVKILRFLEDRTFRPLGSPRGIQADVRLVVASNVDLQLKVQEGTFRGDLFYRLNVVRLHLPPLRERPGDIALLAEYFLRRYGKSDECWSFSPEALEVLQAYGWPGNVRELENVVRHVVIMNAPKVVLGGDLPLAITEAEEPAGDGSFRAAKARAVTQFERSYLQNLLQTHKGNITQASRAARQDRRTFRRLIQKYGLDPSAWARLQLSDLPLRSSPSRASAKSPSGNTARPGINPGPTPAQGLRERPKALDSGDGGTGFLPAVCVAGTPVRTEALPRLSSVVVTGAVMSTAKEIGPG